MFFKLFKLYKKYIRQGGGFYTSKNNFFKSDKEPGHVYCVNYRFFSPLFLFVFVTNIFVKNLDLNMNKIMILTATLASQFGKAANLGTAQSLPDSFRFF